MQVNRKELHKTVLRLGRWTGAVFAKLGGVPAPVLGIFMDSVVTAILVYLYRKVYTGGSPVLEGYRLGAVIGLLFVARRHGSAISARRNNG